MKSLLVRCPTSCEWNGELRSLEDHMQKVCEHILVPCPNNCNNGSTKLRRNNVDYHLLHKCPNRLHSCTKCQKEVEFRNARYHELMCPKRQYTCPHCWEAGVYDERTTTHLEVCPKVQITCTKCSLKISRSVELRHHLVCPNEPVRCKYYSIGCGEKPLRKDATKHEANAQLHLSLATEEVLRLKNIKSILTFRMINFEEHKFVGRDFYSHAFFTSSRYKLCIRVDSNCNDEVLPLGKATHVSVLAHLMKGDNDDSLSWPFTGTVTVELLNQLEDKNHRKKTTAFPADSGASERVVDGERAYKGYGWSKFISHSDLAYKPFTNTQYLKNDTLIFRVSAEAPDYKPWLECTNCV